MVWTLVALGTASQNAGWVLPAPDGGPQPSPSSVHGYVVKAVKPNIVVERDTRDSKTGDSVDVRLTSKTKLFTAFGGLYTVDQLRAGQYVWVWYVTPDPRKAGTPPAAAVVMLWSTDPADKPSQDVRWKFDRPK